jgi:hypothetical protein
MIEIDYLAAVGLPVGVEINAVGPRLVSLVPPQSQTITAIVASAVAGEFDAAPDLMRAIRDRLLELTDWTQMSDSPLTATARAAWATYRQALRDLPHAYSGSGPIPWPTLPG